MPEHSSSSLIEEYATNAILASFKLKSSHTSWLCEFCKESSNSSSKFHCIYVVPLPVQAVLMERLPRVRT